MAESQGDTMKMSTEHTAVAAAAPRTAATG